MEPIFTDKQLNNMSREDLISLMKIVQEQTKKKDTEIQLLKEKQKELEFLNAMLSDRLTLVVLILAGTFSPSKKASVTAISFDCSGYFPSKSGIKLKQCLC